MTDLNVITKLGTPRRSCTNSGSYDGSTQNTTGICGSI
jgi:hypothetical protein